MTMNTAIINVKVKPEEKVEAQRVAEELGLPLSVIIKGFLKQLVRTQSINFSTAEEPSEYLIASLKAADEHIKAGRVSPTFNNAGDAIAWLNDPKRDVEN